MTEATAPPARPAKLAWQPARVVAITPESPTAKTFRLALPGPSTHRAGQHYVLGLRAPDGSTASRSYSVASAPDGGNEIDLTVERLEGGEVSPFLHDVVEVGDELLVRGPIGRFFVWEDGPALLVAGGSGVVPLMAMLRSARATGRSDLVRMVVSVRRPDDLYYKGELPGPEVRVVVTRGPAVGGERPPGRLALDDLLPAVLPGGTAYVCGSNGFCEAAGALLVEAGVPVDRIRIERFGATA